MTDDDLIIVFSKPAEPGKVKTRLIPPFSPEEAADFHLALLDDVVRTARIVASDQVELWVSGSEQDAEPFRDRYPAQPVRRQQGSGLGERLSHAFEDRFAHGLARVLVVGSDHPTLPPAYLQQVLQSLTESDISFGPSRDGGYYAVAVRRQSWPRASATFQNIPWSTGDVLERSLELARRAGLKVSLADEWYDVDRAEDLELLRRDLRPDSAVAEFLRKTRGRRA
jgi:rSAM/selenodomain-associated transferase 1